MKTHFIENTNKQYSIREDGIIISNYKRVYSTKTKSSSIIIYREKELKPNKDGKVNYKIGGRKGESITLTITKLLKEYFKGVKCLHCNNLITRKYFKVCNQCRKTIKNDTNKIWRDNNVDKIKEYYIKHHYKIPKWYIAYLLNININFISKDLYNTKKQQLLLHRQLKQIQNEHSRKHKNK